MSSRRNTILLNREPYGFSVVIVECPTSNLGCSPQTNNSVEAICGQIRELLICTLILDRNLKKYIFVMMPGGGKKKQNKTVVWTNLGSPSQCAACPKSLVVSERGAERQLSVFTCIANEFSLANCSLCGSMGLRRDGWLLRHQIPR